MIIRPWLWPLVVLLVYALSRNTATTSVLKAKPKDAPIWVDPSTLSFRRLDDGLMEELDPPSSSSSSSSTYHRLRGVGVRSETQDVFWVSEPCSPDYGNQEDGQGVVGGKPCLSSFASIRLMAQVLSEPACKSGLRFSLDPIHPHDPLGPYFRKSFQPPECADLYADLLPGAVMFEADWDLKLLLHNINNVGGGLGPWYQTIEELNREYPPRLSKETLTRIWITAESVEVMESSSSSLPGEPVMGDDAAGSTPPSSSLKVLAFGKVRLRLHARSMKRSPSSPTGQVDDGPPPPSLARFIQLANANMDDLITNIRSFQYLQQLVIAQEAARFLIKQGIELPIDSSLCALESPLTANTKIPAVRVERDRHVSLASMVGLRNSSWEDGFLTRISKEGIRNDSLNVWQEENYEEEEGDASQRQQEKKKRKTRNFDCVLVHAGNLTTAAFESYDAFVESGASLECKEDRGPGSEDIDIKASMEEQFQSTGEEDAANKGCPEALATWSKDDDDWRVVMSWSPKSRSMDEAYNTTANVMMWGKPCYDDDNLDDEGIDLDLDETPGGSSTTSRSYDYDAMDPPPIIMAFTLEGLDQVIIETGAVGLVLVDIEPKEEDWTLGEEDEEKDDELNEEKEKRAKLPTRVISRDTSDELLSWLERDGSLKLWLFCGMERSHKPKGDTEKDEAPGPHNLTYAGTLYRTLDSALVDGKRIGCQTQGLSLPFGYELVPATEEILKHVVGRHSWGTSFLLLLGTDDGGPLVIPPKIWAYGTTAQGTRAGQRLESVNIILEKGTFRPEKCDARILIRQIVTFLSYGGYLYRTIQPGVPVDGIIPIANESAEKGEDGRNNNVPPGWEISPVSRGIVQKVVGNHAWSTEALILADGRVYPTLLGKKKNMDGSLNRLHHFHHHVLIRRLERSSADSETGTYCMTDAYKSSAKVRMEFVRLMEEDGAVEYHLELKITETIMIHGGVDLSGVRMVAAGRRRRGEEEDEFFRSIEKEVEKGELASGKNIVVEGSNQTYDVTKAAGVMMSDGHSSHHTTTPSPTISTQKVTAETFQALKNRTSSSSSLSVSSSPTLHISSTNSATASQERDPS